MSRTTSPTFFFETNSSTAFVVSHGRPVDCRDQIAKNKPPERLLRWMNPGGFGPSAPPDPRNEHALLEGAPLTENRLPENLRLIIAEEGQSQRGRLRGA